MQAQTTLGANTVFSLLSAITWRGSVCVPRIHTPHDTAYIALIYELRNYDDALRNYSFDVENARMTRCLWHVKHKRELSICNYVCYWNVEKIVPNCLVCAKRALLHYCIVLPPCEAQDWHVANGDDRGSVLKERALHLSDGQMQRRRTELLGVRWGGVVLGTG